MKKTGFTLVEMLVGIGLVAVMTSVMITQFRGFNQRQTAGMTSERLMQAFKEAKSNSLAGKKDCTICGGDDLICNEGANDKRLDGWRVIVDNNGYTLLGSCEGEVFMRRRETFPDSVEVETMYASPTQVTFTPLNEGTDLTGTMYVSVKGEGASASPMVFSVTTDGEIVPPPPTPTPTPPPPPTNTPVPPTATPTPYVCNTPDVKCVDMDAVCNPSTEYARLCLYHHKCVSADAECTGDYTCDFPDLCHFGSCVFPAVEGTGTCPGSQVCCHYSGEPLPE